MIPKHLLNFKTLKSKNGRDRSQNWKASKEAGGREAEVVYDNDSFARFGSQEDTVRYTWRWFIFFASVRIKRKDGVGRRLRCWAGECSEGKVSSGHEIEDKGRGLLRVSQDIRFSSSRLLLNCTKSILICGSGIWSELNWTKQKNCLLLSVVRTRVSWWYLASNCIGLEGLRQLSSYAWLLCKAVFTWASFPVHVDLGYFCVVSPGWVLGFGLVT